MAQLKEEGRQQAATEKSLIELLAQERAELSKLRDQVGVLRTAKEEALASLAQALSANIIMRPQVSPYCRRHCKKYDGRTSLFPCGS